MPEHFDASRDLNERARQTVLDLVEFGEMAARLVGRGQPAYEEDEALQLAAEALVHRLGEATARLMRQAPQLVTAHPEIPWTRLRATRNIVAHEYARIDHALLWRALARDVPEMTERLRTLDES